MEFYFIDAWLFGSEEAGAFIYSALYNAIRKIHYRGLSIPAAFLEAFENEEENQAGNSEGFTERLREAFAPHGDDLTGPEAIRLSLLTWFDSELGFWYSLPMGEAISSMEKKEWGELYDRIFAGISEESN